MKTLELNQMENLNGGRWRNYDNCVLGHAASGAVAGGVVGLFAGGVGFGPGLVVGWLSGGLGGMVGCAISGYY